MTGWPYCLAEIALYSVFGGIVIAMAFDARDRWKQLREHTGTAEPHDDAPGQGEGAEVSTVRRKLDDEHDQGDDEPPPLAS